MGIKSRFAGILVAAFTMAAGLGTAVHAQEGPATEAPIIQQQETVQRESLSAEQINYINNLHLGYVTSSSSSVNRTVEAGMDALVDGLREKTTIQPAGVAAIDIENDDISYFPFIYWPVRNDAAPLSDEARQRVQDYMDNGGVILFDVQGGNFTVLRRVIGDMSVNPLVPIEEEHTLSKSFYLLANLPGQDNFGTVWVERADEEDPEQVSSVIIGSKNWASAWASEEASRDNEMAMRSGINLVMYALTGNYKSDQVHVPSILDRMNRKR